MFLIKQLTLDFGLLIFECLDREVDFYIFIYNNNNKMNSREQAKALGLEEHITCSLCQDYLSDAVTLTGCLHFFCRSCLLQHLSSAGPDSRKCPKCKIELGSEHIYKRDLRLQELVYKLVPDLFWRQLRRVARRQHRSSRDSNNGSSTTTASFSERRIQQRRMLLQLSTQLCSPNENISLQIEYVPLTKVLAASGDDSLVSLSEKISATTENHKEEQQQNEDIGEEQIILIDQQQQIPSSSSSSSFPPQNICERTTTAIEQQQKQYSFCRYFRCSAKVKIEQLKRLLESKLAMSDFYGVYFVDPQLKFVLEDDFSLEDVVQLFSWSRKSPLRLNFTLAQLPPKEDEDRQEVLEDMPQLDMESGPTEQISLQQQASPIITTTTIKCQNNLNEIPKQGQQEKIEKEEKLIIKEKSVGINEGGKNNIGGEGAVQKTVTSLSLFSPSSQQSSSISASSLQQSSSQQQQQQQNQTTTTKINLSKNIIRSSTQSPPNSTKTAIARLSTAGVSPLRP
uniref:RING-type domain-containing protein n=1 Tax=Meloidogyne incognita TaxID=6306 RepID=A0A914MD28_MELIC